MILVNVLLGFSQFFRAIPIMNPLPWFMIAIMVRMHHLYLAFPFISSHIIIDCGFILFSLINSYISTKNIQRLLVIIVDRCGKNTTIL